MKKLSEHVETWARLYADGSTLKQIAAEYGCSHTTVWKHLRAFGVDTSVGTTAERFWSKVAVTGPTDCWHWTGATHASGYGVFWVDGATTPAHRFAVESDGREIPPGFCACHTCDVRSCTNPAHLFVATQAENVRDMIAKGRARWQKG